MQTYIMQRMPNGNQIASRHSNLMNWQDFNLIFYKSWAIKTIIFRNQEFNTIISYDAIILNLLVVIFYYRKSI